MSGDHIAADIIVPATGLDLQLFGRADLRVDGAVIDPARYLVYKGMILEGVPNFSFSVGYTTASWTLKVGLICRHFFRLLRMMHDRGAVAVMPKRPTGPIPNRPLFDFVAGDVTRSLARLPRQGDAAP